MRALVLAAGLGTRLRPLTDRWPKPAVPLLGQPLLRYTFSVLRRAGVTHVGINTHHLPEVLRATAHAEGARAALAVETVHEPVIQGTGGGIRGLREVVRGEELFVVWNGDILFAPDLGRLCAEHRASGAAATMVLLPMPLGAGYGAVEVDGTGEVRRIAGQGPRGEGLTAWHFSGVHLLSPAVFDCMAEAGPEDINRHVYPRMMARGLSVRGAVVEAPWSDLGTPARYLSAQSDLLTGRMPDVFGDDSPLAGARLRGRAWRRGPWTGTGTVHGAVLLDEGVEVASGAEVGPDVYVGRGVAVPRGASVRRSALLEGARVDAGAALDGVVLWDGGRMS